MSAPKVDVLAVLRSRFAECENGDYSKGLFMYPADARRIHDAVAELIEAAIGVHAACRSGKEPDLIALADALDGAGAKNQRKTALARIGSEA